MQIQRIQTVYLLAAVALLIAALFSNLSVIWVGDYMIDFTAKGFIEQSTSEMIKSTPEIFLGFLIPIISILITIFIYKKQDLQIRFTTFTIIYLIAFIAILVYYLISQKSAIDADYSIKIAFTFPVISVVLLYLAFRGIVKDSLLLKSMDRIR